MGGGHMFYRQLAPSQLAPLFAGIKIVEAIVLGREVAPDAGWKVNPCVDNEYSDAEMIALTHPDEQLQQVLRETVDQMTLGVTLLRCTDQDAVHVWSAATIAARQQD